MSTFTVVSRVDNREWMALAAFLLALSADQSLPFVDRWQDKARQRAKRMGLATFVRVPSPAKWRITDQGIAWLMENGHA
jgi:hypothetical protein